MRNIIKTQQKIKVYMFDCLAGLGYGYLLDTNEKVYLNGLNVITPNVYMGMLLDEIITADIELMDDGDLFARNIERDIKR